VRNAQVLVLGAAFKENVPDVRDTRVKELVEELHSFGCHVEVCDPVVLESDRKYIPAPFVDDPFCTRRGHYDAVVLAVPHRVFRERAYSDYLTLMSAMAQGVFVDVKGVYLSDARADTSGKVLYWNL
jgi:UDP-N-acetyl-D-galactosamine dehydrogenase